MTNEEWIFRVVDSFYQKAKIDVLIGYHFRKIRDFDEHIPRIASFWELQLLGKSSRPLSHPFDVANLHLALPIKKGEVGRWLVLFRKTMDENPGPLELVKKWDERLNFFEGVFLRFFSVENP